MILPVAGGGDGSGGHIHLLVVYLSSCPPTSKVMLHRYRFKSPPPSFIHSPLMVLIHSHPLVVLKEIHSHGNRGNIPHRSQAQGCVLFNSSSSMLLLGLRGRGCRRQRDGKKGRGQGEREREGGEREREREREAKAKLASHCGFIDSEEGAFYSIE